MAIYSERRGVVRQDGFCGLVGADEVAVEAPLSVRVRRESEADSHVVATTMRTPGADVELAVGFLVAEGLLRTRSDYVSGGPCASNEASVASSVEVVVSDSVAIPMTLLERVSTATSACGLCGRRLLDAVLQRIAGQRASAGVGVAAEMLYQLPRLLRDGQAAFAATGGLHAAACFDLGGTIVSVREDIGRHNALDKLVGAGFLNGELPWRDRILMLSGRASFELLQKAAATGVPLVAAVGAPSTLAIDVAEQAGITLVGFLRDQRYNVYSHGGRIGGAPAP